MPLAPGTLLGRYEIRDALGAGGVGEVYRAHDTRLGRTVAIKVLAQGRLADPEMRHRFEREARTIATLNHPHICHLNDVGHQDGVDFLVMEYLDGATLASRLAHGALPVDELFRDAIQIAEALAEAHRHGIIHRDLKPGNVMVTKTGIKLLDFGLAKLQPIASAATVSTQSPTRPSSLTAEGSILGTWPYMAPEQLEGKESDARTDIFAFGAVLYEMATGTRAFQGASHASLIAAILERDPPPLTDRRESATPALRRVVRKCLAKSPDARWQSARDLADALTWIDEERRSPSSVGTAGAAHARRPLRYWAWFASIIAASAIGAAMAWYLPRRTAPIVRVTRFVIQPPPEARVLAPQFAFSPDGRALVYVAADGRQGSLHVRALDQIASRPIQGTEFGVSPAFSPDGTWVAFIANGKLKKASIATGAPPVTLAEFSDEIEQSIAWLPDNTIVLGKLGTGLFRVSADGGTPEKLTTADTGHGEVDHRNPSWLPGGKRLLITRQRSAQMFDVAVLDRETDQIRVIVPNAFDAQYVSSGHLLFARGEALLAAPFDVDRLELTGPTVVVVDRLMTSQPNGTARYFAAEDGSLAYIPAAARTGRRLAWAGGNRPLEPLPIDARAFHQPSLSPDGTRIAVQVDQDGGRDIWIYDLRAGTRTRLTSDGASEAPTWTRDGTRVTFSTSKDGRREIHWQPLDRTAPSEQLLTDAYSIFPGSWSPDGNTLAFTRERPSRVFDIGLFDRAAKRSTMILAGDPDEYHPRISPDGRWLAYTYQPGRTQVYVAPLVGTGSARQISSDSGFAPVWSRDGRMLYYRVGLGDFVAVDVSQLPASIGKPVTVISGLEVPRGTENVGYDVAADGRLLIVQPAPGEGQLGFEIVINWTEELKQRAPTRK